MFQIAFGLVKDTFKAYWWMDILRAFLSLFERIVFTLIPFVYEIFNRIAKNTIISGDLIEEIFKRFQNILGILMVFVLSISILQYIINPDLVTDKVKGAGSMIKKIIIVLILLTTIRPLSIPSENVVEGSYNDYLRRDGIMFGTLYSFQNRIIERNFLGRLILGDEQEIKTSDNASLRSYGNELALTVLKSSIRKNEEVCGDDTEDFYIYDEATDPNDILDNINKECGKKNKYSFTYFPLIGFIEGAFVLVALISFCIDVAVRSIKLAILRIISPIPIISYASPNSSQNNSFSTWLKELSKTYIDLFIRIAMIFFIILIVKRITQGDLTAFNIEEPADIFAIIFIIIGLFMFAKNAPQFIYDALGIKREKGQGLFSGFGKIAAGVGTMGAIGASVAGGIGSARTNREASIKKGSNGFVRGLNTVGGFLGGVGTGLKAGLSAENHQSEAAMSAIDRRNARIASGSTGLGRTGDTFSRLLTGGGNYELMQKDWENREEELRKEEAALKDDQTANNYRKTMMDRVDSKTADSSKTTGTYKGITGNYRDYHSIFQAALSGVGTYKKYYDDSGNEISKASYDALMPGEGHTRDYFGFNGQEIAVDQGTDIDTGLLDENKANYFQLASTDPTFDNAFNDAMNDLKNASGAGAMASNLGNLKADFGNMNHDISLKQQEITNRRNAIADEKSSPKATAAKANSEYRNRNGK